MNSSTVNRLLRMTYDRYRYMYQSRPKAARKKRVRNKWRNRFGRGLSEMMYDSSPLYDMLKLTKTYEGGTFTISFPVE